VTNHFDAGIAGGAVARGTGLGDTLVAVKYRFYRRDSERGTTQASVSVGPKIPTGRTDLSDAAGQRLPASLQAGSGSTDLFVAANWTYTGLFHVRRLVADEDFHALVRSTGTQATRLGNDVESRFWLSYRPYESRNVAREWFIGPELTWLHSGDDRIAGITQRGSGGDGIACGNHYIFRLASWLARLGGDGLGRGAHGRRELHAGSAAHQFWDHATVPACICEPKRRNDEGEENRTADAARCALGPVAQAQIKHIEMRVEGMT